MVFIAESFFSGCISKVINDGKDYSWAKIKSVINDRHDQNMSTKICRIIESAINNVTYNKYKDSDDLYDAIEKLFNEYKNHGDTLEVVKRGLKVLDTDISDQRCENFFEKFYEEIRCDDDLYKAIMMGLEQKGIKISQEEFQRINEKIDRNHTEVIEKLDGINVSNNEEKVDARKLKFQNNKKQDYIKNWNNRLFLHIDNDENPITLADAFIMPDYKIYKSVKRMGFSSEDTLDKLLDKFVKYGKTSTMLITGVPGMGKTSITSWIAQKYENDTNYIILRFRDWEPDELNNGVLKAICNTLKCMKRDLHSKVIILDGFDEIKESGKRDFLLYGFLNDINDFECLKIIITSRSSYIDWAPFFNVIELISFGIEKITKFYQLITGEKMSENNIDISNVDILGIPVILYMSIMADIDLTVKTTRPKLYDSIFAEKGASCIIQV